MDIRRYLTNEPVLASPPSAAYQARKFVRRHRTGVLVGGLTAAILIAFALTTSLQNRVIAHERDRAELKTAKATAVNDFLRDMLVAVDPWASGDHDLTVVEAMDAARANVDSIFAGQSLVAAEMHATMGQAYLGLEKLTEAEEEVRRGLELRVAALGPDDPELAESWRALPKILRFNRQLDEAIAAGKEAVRLRANQSSPTDPDLLAAYDNLAELYVTDRQFAAADSVLDVMFAVINDSNTDLRTETAALLNLRARNTAEGYDDLATADSLFTESIRLLREINPDEPLLPVYLNNLAVNQMTQLKYDEARKTYDEALELLGRRFGADHPEYALVLENLGGIAFRLGDYEECLANLERIRDIRARQMGADHPTVLRTTLNMATVASASGDPERAIAIFNEVLPRLTAINGEIHLDTATTLRNLGLALHRAGVTRQPKRPSHGPGPSSSSCSLSGISGWRSWTAIWP